MYLLKQIIILLVAVNMSKLHIGNNGMKSHEMVMCQGMSISIMNKTGSIRIEALDDLTRIFYWDGNIEQAKMVYRGERWFGKYGAYSAGGRSDVHIVVEEGQYHFCSQLEAEEWLKLQDPKKNYIYTKDGLVVGWYKEYNRIKDGFPDALLVDIVQIYIFGKKPINLANAQDSLFTVTYKNDYVDKIKISQFQPSIPKKIGKRMYSGMSIDIMEERGFKPDKVERCIAKGIILKEGDYISYIGRTDDFLWVTLDKDNRVVLVGQ